LVFSTTEEKVSATGSARRQVGVGLPSATEQDDVCGIFFVDVRPDNEPQLAFVKFQKDWGAFPRHRALVAVPLGEQGDAVRGPGEAYRLLGVMVGVGVHECEADRLYQRLWHRGVSR
jgi:hypothetical protein